MHPGSIAVWHTFAIFSGRFSLLAIYPTRTPISFIREMSCVHVLTVLGAWNHGKVDAKRCEEQQGIETHSTAEPRQDSPWRKTWAGQWMSTKRKERWGSGRHLRSNRCSSPTGHNTRGHAAATGVGAGSAQGSIRFCRLSLIEKTRFTAAAAKEHKDYCPKNDS